ncbi:MAG: hypothetical protein H9W81_16500 [Enterococcus sp.]|nr:hypothetical protein [Enterococcus sp.]
MKMRPGPYSACKNLDEIIEMVTTTIEDDTILKTDLLNPSGRSLLVPALFVPGYAAVEGVGHTFTGSVIVSGLLLGSLLPAIYLNSTSAKMSLETKINQTIPSQTIKKITQIQRSLKFGAIVSIDVREVGFTHLADVADRENLKVVFVISEDNLAFQWEKKPASVEQWDDTMDVLVEVYNLFPIKEKNE